MFRDIDLFETSAKAGSFLTNAYYSDKRQRKKVFWVHYAPQHLNDEHVGIFANISITHKKLLESAQNFVFCLRKLYKMLNR